MTEGGHDHPAAIAAAIADHEARMPAPVVPPVVVVPPPSTNGVPLPPSVTALIVDCPGAVVA